MCNVYSKNDFEWNSIYLFIFKFEYFAWRELSFSLINMPVKWTLTTMLDMDIDMASLLQQSKRDILFYNQTIHVPIDYFLGCGFHLFSHSVLIHMEVVWYTWLNHFAYYL